MAQLFNFADNSMLLGTVQAVDTLKVSIHVKTSEDLRKARVGQLAVLKCPGAADNWLVGIIDRVIKFSGFRSPLESTDSLNEETDYPAPINENFETNTVKISLLGSTRWNPIHEKHIFSRSLSALPDIESKCHILRDKPLEDFMSLISAASREEQSLKLGKYSIDEKAAAYIDGNKLFQRHAALLGSTGSGKSWAVASILERAAKLPTANLIVFDLHGEYRSLDYARHLRIPSPEDLGKSSPDLLYLPYWLLNTEEMQAMFIDRSEFSAHNQVMAFQGAVADQKAATLTKLKKNDILNTFTLDSPIPYDLDRVIAQLRELNEEMEQGNRSLKQGKFYGQFSRLLVRLASKLKDKRYGFLFQAPPAEHEYQAMAELADKLMDYKSPGAQIKIIDFSEAPSDILPIIVGLTARIIYQVQFWTNREQRRPLALVCDEAHLYMPKKEGKNPVEERGIEAFERISKEGRKYGVALMIVSQRPSDVSATVLSQCNNVIALRLTNGDDQSTVKKLMPETLESLLDILPIMDIGEALVVGDAVLLPSRIKISEPTKKPLSATIDFWDKWREDAAPPDFASAVENMRRQGR